MLELIVYRAVDGREPFKDWFDSLDVHAAGKVTTALKRMTAGNLSDVKSLGAGVLERRINWGPGYRVYFARDRDRVIVLLAGGTKNRQQQDITAAQSFWADYKRRTGS